MKEVVEKEIFEMGKIYNYILDVHWDCIPTHIVNELHKDGRITGLIMEWYFPSKYKNITKVENKGADYDVYDDCNKKYESRVITAGGVQTIPSSQIGVGRKFNKEGYENKLLNIDGFILTDIRNFPNISIMGIKPKTIKKFVNNNGKIDSKKCVFENFIKEEENILIKQNIISDLSEFDFILDERYIKFKNNNIDRCFLIKDIDGYIIKCDQNIKNNINVDYCTALLLDLNIAKKYLYIK